ncbi:MAG: hemolysin III family protein [Clostridia bacterium]|nr:hemolysin III family protein [Clostridia bacterium]
MKRTALSDRKLPDYTRGEEIFNMVSHIVGGALGIVALVLCVVKAAQHDNIWGVISGAIYGASLIVLYSMSSIYHGLIPERPKKVMQVLDHCTIYFLIAGTYTPLLLAGIRNVNPVVAWVLFGIVWGCAVLATTFTAIDLNKYKVFSMICYIAMGWCIIFALKTTIQAVSIQGFVYLITGGISYTIGAVLYRIGKKHRYIHSVFHIFVVIGSILHFFCIFLYTM